MPPEHLKINWQACGVKRFSYLEVEVVTVETVETVETGGVGEVLDVCSERPASAPAAFFNTWTMKSFVSWQERGWRLICMEIRW